MQAVYRVATSIAMAASVMALAADDFPRTDSLPRTSTEGRSVRIIRLQHADAASSAETIENLLCSGATRNGAPSARTTTSGLSVACDSNTNSLIASGSARQLDAFANLVESFDAIARSSREEFATWVGQAADSKPSAPVRAQDATSSRPAAAPRDDAPVRVDITVFEVPVPVEKSVLLEAEALEANAATPAGLLEALNAIGPARLLYRIDRTMTFVRPVEAEVEANIPIAVGAASTPAGTKQRSYSREAVGAEFKLSGEWVAGANRQSARFVLIGHLSGVAAGSDSGSPDVPAHVIHRVKESFDGVVTMGRAAVTLSLDAAGDQPAGTAYVVRILLTTP